MNIIILVFTIVYSTLMYLYLHKKTHISLSFLYKDNIWAICLTILCYLLLKDKVVNWGALTLLLVPPTFFLASVLIRFYRYPIRKRVININAIISPADGNIIYIREIKKGDIPMSTKEGVNATLDEFLDVQFETPCWIIGINMTPFDVHRNASPIKGEIIMNKHHDGRFLSLKAPEALKQNERNTIIVDNGQIKVGVVQTASRLVRRIVTYKHQGENVEQGDWIGMIKFGSQVDLILPINCKIVAKVKDQVYVRITILATI